MSRYNKFFSATDNITVLIVSILLDVEANTLCGGRSGGPGGARVARPHGGGRHRAPELREDANSKYELFKRSFDLHFEVFLIKSIEQKTYRTPRHIFFNLHLPLQC